MLSRNQGWAGMKIFITGATGYIGGSVAARLLADGHHVLGLARSDAAAAALRQRGIEPYAGDLTDHGSLRRVAAGVDAVVNAANSDNAFVVRSILPALAGTGKAFIQTSGSSVVSAYDEGEASARVFNEDTPFTPMPEKATRVAIDEAVLASALEGVRAIVVRPSLIYGRGRGANPASVQIPKLIAQAKRAGVGLHIGRGLNIWSNVHIDDVVALYALMLEQAPAGSLFYAENGEAAWKDAAASVSRMLGFGGRTENWPIDDAVAALGPAAHLSFASNSRVRADKAKRMLGWSPKGPSLFDEIERGCYRDEHAAK
jgi:nucleoside-diphosphate-sugar epimerase